MREPAALGDQELDQIVQDIVGTYEEQGGINRMEGPNLPSKESVVEILEGLLTVIFPGYYGKKQITLSNVGYFVGDVLSSIYRELKDQVERSFKYECRKAGDCHDDCCVEAAGIVASHLLRKLPQIRELLKLDIEAAYQGDPAAKSHHEIIVSYPSTLAIATHRLAHELYLKEAGLIARIMSEQAHSLTGIDIHPGAQIGRYFFIDHGTGVVIGETTYIGDHVQMYQGVTLGALAPAKGQSLRGKKRHPTIEDNVIIYSGATILGGDTVIGRGSVVGGNVWLTKSVPPGTKVILESPRLKMSSRTKVTA